MADSDQCNSNQHTYEVLHRPVAGSGVLHRIRAELYERTHKIQHNTDEQLRMRRYHSKQVELAVALAISFVTQPVGPGADDGY